MVHLKNICINSTLEFVKISSSFLRESTHLWNLTNLNPYYFYKHDSEIVWLISWVFVVLVSTSEPSYYVFLE